MISTQNRPQFLADTDCDECPCTCGLLRRLCIYPRLLHPRMALCVLIIFDIGYRFLMRDNLLTHTSGKFGNAWRPLDGHDWRAYYCHLMTNNAAECPTMGTAAPTIKAYLAYGVCILSLRNPSLGLNLRFVLLLGICWWISAILQTSRKYVAIFTCV